MGVNVSVERRVTTTQRREWAELSDIYRDVNLLAHLEGRHRLLVEHLDLQEAVLEHGEAISGGDTLDEQDLVWLVV